MAVGIGIGSGVKRKAGGLGGALGGGNLTPTEQLRAAQSWYSSKSGGNQIIPSEVATPGGLAVLGASESTVTNDPTFLDHDGTDYVWFPAGTGNYAQLTDNPTGGSLVSMVVRRQSGTLSNVVAQCTGPSSARFYLALAIGGGSLITTDDSDGSAETTVFTLAGAETANWLQVELDIPNDQFRVRLSNDTTLDFDSVAWESWIAWVPIADTVRPIPTFVNFTIYGSAGSANIGLYEVRYFADDVEVTGARFNASTAGTVYPITRSTTGLKTAVVTRPVYLFDGTDDYIQLPENDKPTFTATSGKHTVVVAFTAHDGVVFKRLWASSDATAGAWLDINDDDVFAYVRGSSNVVANKPFVKGDVVVVAHVVEDGTVRAYSNSTGLSGTASITGIGTVTHQVPKLGARTDNVANISAEIFDALSFPGVALTEAELDVIAEKLIAGTYYPSDLPPRLLGAAQSWYSSKDGGTQVIEDRNDGFPATVGSVGAARIISDGLYLPGTVSNNASTPDAASLDITGDIDIRCHATMEDWTPTSNEYFAGKYLGGTERSYYFRLNATTGYFALGWTDDGATIRSISSTAAPTVANGAALHVRATADVDNGASGTTVTFYTSEDGIVWTQLGTQVVTAGVLPIWAGTADLVVGELQDGISGTTEMLIHSVELRDGIDGTIVASPDFTAQATDTTSFDDTQGNTWTVTGVTNTTNDPTFLEHDGADYVWFPGTSGNATTHATIDMTGDIEVVVDGEWDDSVGTFCLLISDRSGSSGSFWLRTDANNSNLGMLHYASAAAVSSPAAAHGLSDGDRFALRARRLNTGGAGGVGRWEMFISINGGAESQILGSDHTGAFAVDSSSVALAVGGRGAGTSSEWKGKVYSASVSNIGGSTLATLNPSDLTGWTVNRSATGLKTAVVTRPVYLFDGTDDYLELPAADTPTFTNTTGKLTVVVAFRKHATLLSFERLYSTGTGAVGTNLYIDSSSGEIKSSLGAGINVGGLVSLGALHVGALVVHNGFVATYLDIAGLSTATDMTGLPNPAPHGIPRVGQRVGTADRPLGAEVLDVLSFPGVALTETELDVIAAKLIAGTYNAN